MSSSEPKQEVEIKEEQYVPSKQQESTKQRPPVVKVGHKLRSIQTKQVLLRSGRKKGNILTLTDATLILTPINLLNPQTELAVMAKNDYLVEMPKFYSGEESPMWDDTGSNQAAVGDVFFFCHNQVKKGQGLGGDVLRHQKVGKRQ
eukprot:TRINITY_DN1585_c0_g1_i1.p3 TRINITY_DN1585_c0_g1~~TRINITY_DN1585_c0_g1_i1.p3  ORF type:complete len:146 (+),score=26.63 TRINITY_DN1585_c0_g1_i1:461-898(+)